MLITPPKRHLFPSSQGVASFSVSRALTYPKFSRCTCKPVSKMAAVLVPVRMEEVEQQASLLSYAVGTAKSRVYIYLTGPSATEGPSPSTLDYLAHCYDPAARLKPTFDVVPLFPCVGWTPERLAELPGVEEMVAGAQHLQECNELLDQLNAAREHMQQPSLSLTLTAGGPAPGAEQQQQQQPGQQGQRQGQQGQQQQQDQEQLPAGTEPEAPQVHSRVVGGWEGPLKFKKVAVGGTFDRLHAGHRLLLAATALVATENIFVGVTAQKLLLNKKNKDLLEPYEVRAAAAVNYMRAVNPGVEVIAGPLNDPNDPTVAATDSDFDAIVVSEETIPGAEAINRWRVQHGFQPLVIVVVGLIASHSRAAKLSSTDLRNLEAERAAATAAAAAAALR